MSVLGSLRNCNEIKEGHMVILYGGRDEVDAIIIAKGKTVNNRRGLFRHDDLIGIQFGTKIWNTKKSGWLYALFPTPELWTKTITLRTQILFQADISIINLYLELKPGSIVIESGTGSGALSLTLARSIAPNGKLYTFEFNESRVAAAKNDFELNKVDHIITTQQRDVCKDGFQLKAIADAVFLDLPSPWEVLSSAKEAMIPNAKFCSFSPCIEQVQRVCEGLKTLGFVDISTMECLLRLYDVRTMEMESLEQPDLESPTEETTEETKEEDKEIKIDEEEKATENMEEETKEIQQTKEGKESKEEDVESKKRSRSDIQDWFEKIEKKKKIGIAKFGGVKRETMVVTRPFSDTRGHTGFLTFARLPVPCQTQNSK